MNQHTQKRAAPDWAWSQGSAMGFSLVEITVAMLVLSIGLVVLVQQVSLGYRGVQQEQDRSFAFQKATAIIAEIQNSIDRGLLADTAALDDLADGLQPNAVLTTLVDDHGIVFPPDHAMSGNTNTVDGDWVWGRKVVVTPHEEQASLRYVNVHVGRRPTAGGNWRDLAHAAAVMALPAAAQPARQTVDLYVLAIGNALSDLGPMDEVRAAVDRQVTDLQSVDQGVEFRVHWITRMGYGRDALYAPWCDPNAAPGSEVPYALHYPGRTSDGRRLYAPDMLEGRAQGPLGIHGGYDSTAMPYPVAIADRWNHCLPVHEALALHQQRVAAGLEDPEEPPLDLFLARLHDDPGHYRNAIILNLHGSGIPTPPLRPVPDPARDGLAFPGIRVVTHAASVFTPRTNIVLPDHGSLPARDAEFRVHAWATDPSAGPYCMDVPITIRIPGPDLSQRINAGGTPSLVIRRLHGGVSPFDGSLTGAYLDYLPFSHYFGRPPEDTPTLTREMYLTAGYSTTPYPHTWVQLHNTPLVAPVINGNGLDPSQRLYGVDHIPSPVGTGNDFVEDLSTPGTGPKNTARWRIRIPAALLQSGDWPNGDQAVEVLTSIGTDPAAGTCWPTPFQPHNVSRAVTWWTDSPDDVPALAYTHLVGDPRLVPHSDLMAGGIFAHGYNWCFDDLTNGSIDVDADWPGLDGSRMHDGFGAGLAVDIARYGKLIREGLQKNNAVWIDAGGAVGQRALLGGGLGDVVQRWKGDSLPLPAYGPAFGGSGTVVRDTVRPPQFGNESGGMQVLRAATGGAVGFPWFGGLASDSAAGAWQANGNVPAGTLSDGWYAAPLMDVPAAMRPQGADLASTSGGFVGAMGPTAILNHGGPSGTFGHPPTSQGSATSTPAWVEILDSLGESMPATMPSSIPFSLTGPPAGPMPWQSATETYAPAPAQLLEPWWNHPSGDPASGLVASTHPDGLQVGFFAPITFDPIAPDAGGLEPGEQVVRHGLLAALRSLHRLGQPDTPGRIPHDALVMIQDPQPEQLFASPIQIRLRWSTLWRRYDGEHYTDAHPKTFKENEADYHYAVKVSGDEGQTWAHAVDGAPTVPGERPTVLAHRVQDAVPGSESLIMATPANRWPTGKYWIRVECFHSHRQLHLGWHEVRIHIRR